MPAGVGSHFLQVLAAEQRFAQRRLLVAAAVTLLLLAPAYLLWPWQGMALHGAGVVLGAAVGAFLARNATQAYERSVRQGWQEWMRLAVGCESVRDIHRRVHGGSLRNRAYLHGALLTLLWVLEIALLAIAFHGESSTLLSAPVLVANGALMAGLGAYFLVQGRWVREFGRSVSDLVESGELGVWGVL